MLLSAGRAPARAGGVSRGRRARLAIMAHCGAQSTADTVALAAHAAEAGAVGVSVIAPPYFPLDEQRAARAPRGGRARLRPAAVLHLRVHGPQRLSGVARRDRAAARARAEPRRPEGLGGALGALRAVPDRRARHLRRARGADRSRPRRWRGRSDLGARLGACPSSSSPAVRERTPEATARAAAARAALERFPMPAALKTVCALRGVPIGDDVRAPLRALDDDERSRARARPARAARGSPGVSAQAGKATDVVAQARQRSAPARASSPPRAAGASDGVARKHGMRLGARALRRGRDARRVRRRAAPAQRAGASTRTRRCSARTSARADEAERGRRGLRADPRRHRRARPARERRAQAHAPRPRCSTRSSPTRTSGASSTTRRRVGNFIRIDMEHSGARRRDAAHLPAPARGRPRQRRHRAAGVPLPHARRPRGAAAAASRTCGSSRARTSSRPSVAYPHKADVDAAYARLVERMLAGGALHRDRDARRAADRADDRARRAHGHRPRPLRVPDALRRAPAAAARPRRSAASRCSSRRRSARSGTRT